MSLSKTMSSAAQTAEQAAIVVSTMSALTPEEAKALEIIRKRSALTVKAANEVTNAIESATGGWKPLQGKTDIERVENAAARMIDGAKVVEVAKNSKVLYGGYLLAMAIEKKSVIGPQGSIKSAADFVREVNSELPVNAQYQYGTLQQYAAAYKVNAGWYMKYGKKATDAYTLAKKELTEEELKLFVSLCESGGDVQVQGVNVQVPAMAIGNPSAAIDTLQTVLDSVGKPRVMVDDKPKAKREPKTPSEPIDASFVDDSPAAGQAVSSGAAIDANVAATNKFVADCKIAQASLDVVVSAMSRAATAYVQAKAIVGSDIPTILEQEYAKIVVNKWAASLWKGLRDEATKAHEELVTKQNGAAIMAVVDATNAGSDQPESITLDGVTIVVTDEHKKAAAKMITEKAAGKPKK